MVEELSRLLNDLRLSHEATVGELGGKAAEVVRLSKILEAQSRIRDRLEISLKTERDEHAAMRAVNRELAAELDSVRADHSVVKHEFDSVVADRDRAELESAMLRSRTSELEAHRDTLSRQNEDARNAVADLDGKLATMRDRNDQLVTDLEASRAEFDYQRKQSNELSRQLSIVTLERSQLKEKIELLQTEATERMQRDGQEIHFLRKSMSDAETTIVNLTRERDQFVIDLRQLENKNYGLQSRSQTTEKLLSSAREKFFILSKELRRTSTLLKVEEREKASLLQQMAAKEKEIVSLTDAQRALAADNASLRSSVVELSTRLDVQSAALSDAERELKSSSEQLAQSLAKAEDRERDFALRMAEAESRIRNVENERSMLEGRLVLAREYRHPGNPAGGGTQEASASIITLGFSKGATAAE
ncbi:MAG: hypothetical protein O9972_15120 [Burkholderiales bacterium]|nr:hypothetical protein [Burkholderiales bacterium]